MKDLHAIPAAAKDLPLIGHLIPLLRDPLGFITSLSVHGELVRVRLGPLSMVVICDPELTRQALVDDRVFDKGGPFYDRMRELIGDGIGSCPHSAHRRLRRLAQPAFRPARLPGYAQAMTACIEETAGSWRAGQILDVPVEMLMISSKITVATLFSGTLRPAETGQLLDDFKTVADGFYRRMFLIPPLDRLPTPKNRSYLRARTRLRDTVDRIIAQRRADGTDRGDLLSALLSAHDPEGNGRGMTNAEISDTVVTFFMAGTETTAVTLAWALDLLGTHPQVEQQLHAEADTALNGAPATHADLPRLELTQRVITETLRLRSPGCFFTRTVTADTRLGGHLLPAGTTVVYSPYLIHHRPDLYDSPESFDPDRWNPKRPQPPRNALIPFAAGARRCIGENFAMTVATLALATITARWRLEHLPGHHEARPTLGLVVKPHELRMQAMPRTSAHTRRTPPDACPDPARRA